MLSAVHSKLSGQGDAGNADTAGVIVYITERHQGRISVPFGAPAVQGLDGPVSYTHLDVYKRQGLIDSFMPLQFCPQSCSKC